MIKSVSKSTSVPPLTFYIQGQNWRNSTVYERRTKNKRTERRISELKFPTNTEGRVRDSMVNLLQLRLRDRRHLLSIDSRKKLYVNTVNVKWIFWRAMFVIDLLPSNYKLNLQALLTLSFLNLTHTGPPSFLTIQAVIKTPLYTYSLNCCYCYCGCTAAPPRRGTVYTQGELFPQ